MKKSYLKSTIFSALVVSSLFAGGAVRADDVKYEVPDSSVGFRHRGEIGVGMGGNGGPSQNLSYEAQFTLKDPKSLEKEYFWSATPTEKGKLKSIGYHLNFGSGKDTSNPNSTLNSSSKVGAEYTWGDYAKNSGGEAAKSWVLQGELFQNSMVGESGGKVRFGKQATSGRDFAPVGSMTAMPMQIGLSVRNGLYLETGASQQDPKNGTNFLLNLSFEEQIQYCARLDQAERNAICLSILANGVLGSEIGMRISGRAVYEHVFSGKGSLYAGVEGTLAGAASGPRIDGSNVTGVQALGVVGVAASAQ